jgi:hypothetical protein
MFIKILKTSNGKANVDLEDEKYKFVYKKCVSIYIYKKLSKNLKGC